MNKIGSMPKWISLVGVLLAGFLAGGSSAQAQTSLHYPAVMYKLTAFSTNFYDTNPQKVCAKYGSWASAIDPNPAFSYGVVPDRLGVSQAGSCQKFVNGQIVNPADENTILGVCQWNPTLQAVTGIRGGIGSNVPMQDAGYVTCSCPTSGVTTQVLAGTCRVIPLGSPLESIPISTETPIRSARPIHSG